MGHLPFGTTEPPREWLQTDGQLQVQQNSGGATWREGGDAEGVPCVHGLAGRCSGVLWSAALIHN